MHPALIRSHVRCTLIESFSGKVCVIRPGFKKEFDEGLLEAKKFVDDQGWDISIFILKGSLLLKQIIARDHSQSTPGES